MMDQLRLTANVGSFWILNIAKNYGNKTPRREEG